MSEGDSGMTDNGVYIVDDPWAHIIPSKKSHTIPLVNPEPCPLCGSGNIHNWASDDHTGQQAWSVMCFSCECEGPHCDTEQAAIDRWNARA